MLSYPENVPFILKAIEDVKPKTVLDIGPGLGKYGLMIREKDFEWQIEQGIDVPTDKVQIDCADITPFFLERAALKHIYNNVYNKSLFDWQAKELDYDLILLIDVIEHYDIQQIKDWLYKVKARVLLSTPKNTVMFTRHLFNDSNHHKSQWRPQDFNGMTDYSSPLSFIFLK